VELVCLAGYMRLLSPEFVAAFPNRILNIHPSLLPAFPGLEAQEQAFDYGVKVTGCTVHFVDEHSTTARSWCSGPIPVLETIDDAHSLAGAILASRGAHRLYRGDCAAWPAGSTRCAGGGRDLD
jgi:phosphoribosylglycinamide formyltransferase 1